MAICFHLKENEDDMYTVVHDMNITWLLATSKACVNNSAGIAIWAWSPLKLSSIFSLSSSSGNLNGSPSNFSMSSAVAISALITK